VGAAALKDQPFPEEVLQRGGVYARTAAQDFSKIVAKAPSKDTAQKRAELYAELIGTCAACHLAVE
jgi:mono/diheme cytochrome c family protein